MTLQAKQDVTVQASKIKAGDAVAITAEEGQVALLTIKDSQYDHSISSNTGWITWTSRDKGQYAETVVNTLIESGNGFTITSRDGVTVEYKQTGDLRQDVQQLAQIQGLEWMGTLLQRDDIDWKAVQENYSSWDKKQSGLAPGAMLTLSIVAGAVMAGAASSLALCNLGLKFSASGTIISTATQLPATAMQLAMYSALTAGYTSLAVQVTTGLADTAAGGDFGDHMKSMLSETGVRSLLSSMVLAGILSTYGETFEKYSPPMEILATSTVKTLTSTIVGGEELESAFLTALGSSFGGYVNGKVSAEDLNNTVKVILAGAAGAAGAAIAGGDPMQGAMSAMVAELAKFATTPELTEEQKKTGEEAVQLSNCGYKDTSCKMPNGYAEATKEQLENAGIDPAKLKDEKSGFEATSYINQEAGKVFVSFRGTDGILDGKDWAANIAQAFGRVGTQYQEVGEQGVLEKMKGLADSLGCDLYATGHSLGGGLATVAASSGFFKKAIVFNPTGVNEKTIAEVGGNLQLASDKTTAYVSRGDILTNAQDILSFLLPQTVGTRVLVGDGGVHGIRGLIESFER